MAKEKKVMHMHKEHEKKEKMSEKKGSSCGMMPKKKKK